jgi:hypothetical protein
VRGDACEDGQQQIEVLVTIADERLEAAQDYLTLVLD